MSMQTLSRVFLTVSATCLLLGACDDDDDGVSPEDQATVRLVNAVTGTTDNLTLRADGTLIGSTAAFGTAGSCRGLVPGSTDLTVTTTGSTTALVSLSDQDLDADTRYTVLASGSTLAPNLVLLPDIFTSPGNGRARLRVINTVGALSPFDVYVGTPGSALGTANDVGVTFNEATDYLDVPEGVTQVRVTTPGTQTVIGTSANFTLNEGNVRTIFFTPASGGGGFASFVVPACS